MDQKPSLGRIIIVHTPSPINGQHEHAAIVTQVWDADKGYINATVFPGSGEPRMEGSIGPKGSDWASEHRYWKWPERV